MQPRQRENTLPKGYGPPAWWEERRDGGQAIPELVKPWGGAGGQPPPREALSSHLPVSRGGERNEELDPSDPPSAPATYIFGRGMMLQPRIPWYAR